LIEGEFSPISLLIEKRVLPDLLISLLIEGEFSLISPISLC
jgi:hypothetical protein